MRLRGSLVRRFHVRDVGVSGRLWLLLAEPSRRIVAVPAPGMASEQAVDREDESFQSAVLPEGLNRVC